MKAGLFGEDSQRLSSLEAESVGENSKEAILQRRARCWAGHSTGLDQGSGGKNREVQSLDIFVNDLNKN